VDEPEPFWAGADQADRISRWQRDVDWSEAWGEVTPAAELNGPSGRWVEDRILGPCSVDRSSAWITDCLDTYRLSIRMREAIESVYAPFATAHNLPAADVAAHASEAQIVAEAVASHMGRIRHELDEARPSTVVTLGNAALRVFRALLDSPAGPTKLSAQGGYAEEQLVHVAGRRLRWLPLAHPASPDRYQTAHDNRASRSLRPSTP
jgi:hypothetical protein